MLSGAHTERMCRGHHSHSPRSVVETTHDCKQSIRCAAPVSSPPPRANNKSNPRPVHTHRCCREKAQRQETPENGIAMPRLYNALVRPGAMPNTRDPPPRRFPTQQRADPAVALQAKAGVSNIAGADAKRTSLWNNVQRGAGATVLPNPTRPMLGGCNEQHHMATQGARRMHRCQNSSYFSKMGSHYVYASFSFLKTRA